MTGMHALVSRAISRWLRLLGWLALTAAVYLLIAWLTEGWRAEGLFVWPSAAVAVIAVLARGNAVAPAIFVAAWISNRDVAGWNLEASTLIAAADTLGPLVGLALLRRRRVGWNGFQTVGDTVWFIGAMGVLNAAICALGGQAAAALFGFGRAPVQQPFGLGWWVADMTSIVVLAPAADLIRRQWGKPMHLEINLENALLPAAAVFGTVVIFTWPATTPSALPFAFATLLLLPLLWSAMRLPLAVSMTATAAVCVLVVSSTLSDLGPLQSMAHTGRDIAVQVMVLSLSSTILIAGLLASERDRALKQLRDTNINLEKKVSRRTAALQVSQATTQTQLRFQESLLNALPNPVAFCDPYGRFTRVNTAFNLLVGLGGPEIHGRTGAQILGPTLGRIWEEMDTQLLSGASSLSREAPLLLADHEPTVWILNKALVRDAVSRQVVGVVTSMQDITPLKRLQAQLSEDERRFRFLAEESPVPLVINRLSDSVLLYANKAAEEMFRGSYAERGGQSMLWLWPDAAEHDRLVERLYREGTIRGVEQMLRRFDGSTVWLLISVTRARYRDDDALIFAFKDITEAKERETALRTLAYTDALTGIPNRRHFLERAALDLADARREGQPVSVIVLDIDRFKQVNDTLGHHGGDMVIRCFARTCMAQLRGNDICGRLGGDEFAILLPQTNSKVAVEVAARLLRAIREARCMASLAGDRLSVTTSIGVAEHLPLDGNITIDELLDRADQALYRAKEGGRDRVELWTANGTVSG